MLADNIVYLKKNYIELYQAIKEWEESKHENRFFVELTKNNFKTLKYKNDLQQLYLHSKYDPLKEAQLIVNQFLEKEEINDDSHIMFYGVGLGYHIDAFLERFPQTSFSIYEPSIEIFDHFLNNKSLKSLPLKNVITIQCEYSANVPEVFFTEFKKNSNKRLILFELPIYKKIFEQEYSTFLSRFKEFIKSQRSRLNVNIAFKKNWTLNSVNNFETVLKTPNISMGSSDIFRNSTAILVSAGPSLDDEIQNIRNIKEKGLAFIFSVGSAINTLVHNDIYPDAMCTYDPSYNSYIVFQKVNDLGIDTIPMIFGSSAGNEVVMRYQGPKYHMITSQDTVARYFLKSRNNDEIDIISDAPTIAAVTLELLYKLGFSRIILVGQNLALKGEKDFSQGIDYGKNGISASKEQLLLTKDVHGNEIYTRDSFNRMRFQIERYIEKYNINVINTTKGGADIKGTVYKPLEKIICEELLEKVVEGNEFERINQNGDIYDSEYIEEQLEKLNTSIDQYFKLLVEAQKRIKKLDEALSKNKNKLIPMLHKEMDYYIQQIESNTYFEHFVLPMNRVECELLSDNIQRTRKEKSEISKAKKIIKPTENFINLLCKDEELNRMIMIVLTNAIQSQVKRKLI